MNNLAAWTAGQKLADALTSETGILHSAGTRLVRRPAKPVTFGLPGIEYDVYPTVQVEPFNLVHDAGGYY